MLFDGDAGIDVPVEKRNLGLVFQSYALWPHRTVFENVAYGLRLRNVPAAEIGDRVTQALANLGLGALAERLPHQLSGGQQQRVAIARALVYNPPVVLMDEPLSNLDAKLREEARAWLRELIVRLGLSALVVTHDQTEAMAMSDKILLLNFGQIEQQGTPEDMYNRPQTQFTAEFMGSNNRLPGTIAEVAADRALLAGDGFSLWGRPRGKIAVGDKATGIIRLERMKTASGTRRESHSRRARDRDVHGRSQRASLQAGRTALARLRHRCARAATAFSSCPRTISGCSPRRLNVADGSGRLRRRRTLRYNSRSRRIVRVLDSEHIPCECSISAPVPRCCPKACSRRRRPKCSTGTVPACP